MPKKSPHLALLLGLPLVCATWATANPPADWLDRMSAQLAHQEYRFTEQADGRWSAPNRAQDLRSYFGAQGTEVISRSEVSSSWSLSMRLSAVGRDGALVGVDPVDPTVLENTVSFDYGNVVEWYRNDARGIKQGFDVIAAPAGQSAGSELVLRLQVAGLCACATEEGQAIVFRDNEGSTRVTYDGLVVYDADEARLPATLRVVNGAVEIRVEDVDAIYPIVVDPVLTSPNWSLAGEQVGAELGSRVAAAGDVNGDGFGDLLITAPGFDNGNVDAGGIFLFLGSMTGPSTDVAWSVEGEFAATRLGDAVVGVGDVNGDSFADVLVGDPRFSGATPGNGRARLYLGSASGLGTQPSWELEGTQEGEAFGEALDWAGDVNADGIADVVVASPGFDTVDVVDAGMARVFAGSLTGLSSSPLWTVVGTDSGAGFAEVVAGGGDVNADGYSDVLVGTPRATIVNVEEGEVALYSGGASGLALSPNWTFRGAQDNAGLGAALSRAGDVDGDGFADFLVGAPLWNGAVADGGRALLFLGTATVPRDLPSWEIEGDVAGAFVGATVATAGDVNGDGLADYLVGAPGIDEVYLHRGSRAGLSTAPNLVITGAAGSSFGSGLSSAGDLNGDGFSDLVIGAPLHDDGEADEGFVQVILGQPAPPEDVPSLFIEGGSPGAQFGFNVASAGDVNGDGYGDVITGTRFFDGGVFREGAAFLYLGSPNGLSTTPVWQDQGNQYNSGFGISVATAGDINADGYDDFLVGAANFDGTLNDQGRFLVYYGSPTGPNQEADLIIDGPQEECYFGRFARAAGDVNGDGFADVIVASPEHDNEFLDEGRAFLFLGSALGLDPVPFWVHDGEQAFARFSRPVSTAGDVNGDGLSDVIIGERRWDNGEIDEGRVLVFLGDAVTGLQSTPVWNYESNQQNGRLGISVRTAGDVNGDGFSDVIVGAYQFRNNFTNEGRAFVFHGSATGPSVEPDWVVDGQQTRAELGWCVAPAGDVNGDGFSDVLVSAPLFSDVEYQGGAVFLYMGSAVGLATSAAWQAVGTSEGEFLGFSVDGAVDINGDGFSDVIVGATGYSGALATEGALRVYYGNGGLGAPRDIQQRRVDNSAPLGLYSLSDSNTSFRLSSSLRTAAGRGLVGMEIEVKEFGTPFDGLGLVLGGLSDTGVPGGTGSQVPRSVLLEGLQPSGLYHWRLRHLTHDPIFGHSPWFSAIHNGMTEADLRLALGIAGVTDLSCNVFSGGVQLDWTLGDTYTAIVVLRDGAPIATVAGTTTSFVDNAPGFGTSHYTVTGFDGSTGTPSATCQVAVLPPTISALTCVANGLSIELSWSNNFAYDAIELSRGGLVLAVLAGDSRSFVDNSAPAGQLDYVLTPIVSQAAAVAVGCVVQHLALPVAQLLCQRLGDTAELSWVAAPGATAIEVVRDGVLLQMLSPESTGFIDTLPFSSSHTYEVTTVVDALRSVAVACTLDLTVAPVDSLTCHASVTEIALDWVSAEDYSAIRVFRNGVMLATLGGTATGFVDSLPSDGIHTYEVVAARGQIDALAVSCSAELQEGLQFTFSVAGGALEYSPTTGDGSFATEVTISEGSSNVGAPNDLQGFSLGLVHDSNLLHVEQVVMDPSLLALNAGSGPDFFQSDLVDGGVVIVAVFALTDPNGVVLPMANPIAVAQVHYATESSQLVGDLSGASTPLSFQNGLGTGLPIENRVVVNGASHSVDFVAGVVELQPSAALFTRSDCNVDGSTNLTDATFLLGAFFANRGTITCGDACDSNDDANLDVADVVYTLMYLFANGTPPVAPFGECGADSTEDPLSCESYNVCPAP